jgi:CheY-like chemotaxis protein
MPSVLICAGESVVKGLQGTILWRDDMERRTTASAQEAITMTLLSKPDLIVVDIKLASADALVAGIRANPVTRAVSIVIIAHGEFDASDLRFLDAGANAILRFPASRDWDDRLSALLYVPVRRTARLAALLQFEASGGIGVDTVAGTILNLSERGMLVETDIDMAMGSDLDFKIHLRDVPTPLIGCGQIVRQDSPRKSGVRFYGLEADGLERIRRFVAKGTKGGKS